MKKLCFILIFLTVLSCKQNKSKHNVEYHTHTNKIDTLISSTSIDTLGQIINLKEFKPYKVRFIYFPETVCGLENELTPNWHLETVMFFDDNTIKKLNTFIKVKNDTIKASLNTYFFGWLNTNEVKVFSKSKTQFSKIVFHNHNEPFSKSDCDYIIIDNAVFLRHESKK
ncbi:MAG TPA: hypothetical protein PLJ42_04380 [Chitinophagales bacterium]|jgi:hypothetical protein|nr:hypothetical protein [Chitinophagales bacterium]HQV77927.1 hypothetical protein [Chitinophagales bacterium]HQW78649.1 hypothetical protein [Chitinophagales bacterium]HRB19043.1 hypothetical protein [Chitinophagales bacterium]HRB67903.1 hypothetical protein [Chitinophagales bacterium]